MCHSILFQYIFKILVNVIRFSSISFKFVIKVNTPCQEPCFTCGARAALGRLEYFCLVPLAKCLTLRAEPDQYI